MNLALLVRRSLVSMDHEACDACDFDGASYDDIALLAALRTLGLRWRTLIHTCGGELRVRPEPEVWSAIEYVAHSRDITALHAFGVEQALTIKEPRFPAIESEELIQSAASAYRDADSDQVVNALEGEATRLALLANDAGTQAWSRGLTIGERRMDVRRLLEHALHDSLHHLIDVERGLGVIHAGRDRARRHQTPHPEHAGSDRLLLGVFPRSPRRRERERSLTLELWATRPLTGTVSSAHADAGSSDCGLAAIMGAMETRPSRDNPYYRDDLALVHHLGFGFHADACAPGILRLLEPFQQGNGLVVEIGCGSGLLTAYLADAGLKVVATYASEAMLSLAHSHAPGATEFRRLTLPVDSIPLADAIVGVGHTLNYLDEEADVDEALVAIATSLRPGGIMAIDLCDLEWGVVRVNQPPMVWRTDDWALMTEFSLPKPNRYVRQMTTFVRQDGGTWRRDDERHENVLIDTTKVPDLLARHGVEATVSESFGDEHLPTGLVAVVGRKAL